MSAEVFFDTNVIVYSLSSDAEKAARASALIGSGGVVSVQVLNEFVNVSVRKFAKPLQEIRKILSDIRQLCTVKPLGVETHDLALDIAENYRFNIFDSLIVASALLAGCKTLYTEDLQHGQVIEGLTVRNPFKP